MPGALNASFVQQLAGGAVLATCEETAREIGDRQIAAHEARGIESCSFTARASTDSNSKPLT